MKKLNLFEKLQNDASVARIVKRHSNTLFSVKDSRGRQFQVESNGNYRVGQAVLIKGGVIIGKTRVLRSPNYFNV